MNKYWTQPVKEPRQVDCPSCGVVVDIDGPLEDQHFVFAMRVRYENGRQVLERSNLGTCPDDGRGLQNALERMRGYLGYYGGSYYQGAIL